VFQITPSRSASYVMNKLQENKYEAYLVGGCVRDALLGLAPKDWDICTSALPHEICILFPNSLDFGIKHGTVTVIYEQECVEVTTWRTESGYTDSRHPDKVEFSTDLYTDLSRRDFTINAMAWNHVIGLIDYFQGYQDLNDKLIRCVGEANERFNEDSLRMLRAIRFASQLGFHLQTDTYRAIISNRQKIGYISAERIQLEISRTLTGFHPEKAALWWDTGLHHYLFSGCAYLDPSPYLGELMEYLHLSGIHLFSGKHESELTPEIFFWSSLFIGIKKRDNNLSLQQLLADIINVHAPSLRFSNKIKKGIQHLLTIYELLSTVSPRNIRFIFIEFGYEWLNAALTLHKKRHDSGDDVKDNDATVCFSQMSSKHGICDLYKSDNMIHGKKLKEMLKDSCKISGPEFGSLLNCLKLIIAEKPEYNHIEALTPMMKSILQKKYH